MERLFPSEVWQQSDDFKQLMKESEDFTVSIKTLQENAGMEIWFDLPSNLKSIMKPPFRKQVLVAIMVVLPLIFVIGKIADPLLAELPIINEIKIVIKVLIAAPLITLIMPKVTKLLYPWLYSKPKEQI